MSMKPRQGVPIGWTRVKLGDIATEYSVRVENPAESGFDRFVGSNHIGRFELNVSSWGSTSDVSSSMKAFKPGDYLLVRRSLYASDFRERAARADFHGVCSGDILTIRERTDVLAPGFLSVVLNTPEIWAYIVAHATGSITRRIKWHQLREYEHALPPIEEQRRIVEALGATDANAVSLRSLCKSLTAFRASAIDDLTFGSSAPKARLGSLCEMQNGRPFPSGEYSDEGIRLLRPGNLGATGYLIWSDDITKHVPDRYRDEANDFVVNPGNVLINLTAQSLEDGFMGRVCYVRDGDESVLNQRIGRFRDYSELLLPEYLFRVLQSTIFQRFAKSVCEGSKIKHLFWQHIRQFEFPLPSKKEQLNAIQKLRKVDASLEGVESRRSSASKLQEMVLQTVMRDLQAGNE